ncbi:hypothetical protein [Neobacillus niacini]|nr:hypothetical protein [Neobacillus niacini]
MISEDREDRHNKNKWLKRVLKMPANLYAKENIQNLAQLKDLAPV